LLLFQKISQGHYKEKTKRFSGTDHAKPDKKYKIEWLQLPENDRYLWEVHLANLRYTEQLELLKLITELENQIFVR
jgi:hypothetical protein